jgi:hypothetical protein
MDISRNGNNIDEINDSISVGERHFNTIQHQYRFLASSWMLALFAAIGYVFTSVNTPFDKFTITFFLSTVSSIGFTLIWMLDLRVYHQLLEAYFVEGLKLEDQHKDIPQVRNNMLYSQSSASSEILTTVVYFYLFCIGISLILSTGALILILNKYLDVAAILGAMYLIPAAYWLRYIYKNTGSLLLEDFLKKRNQPSPHNVSVAKTP